MKSNPSRSIQLVPTVIPVDDGMNPLGEYYLWCDHRAKEEAAQITEFAHQEGLKAIEWCGGVYSSEWGFAKLLHWLRHNPDKRGKFKAEVGQRLALWALGTTYAKSIVYSGPLYQGMEIQGSQIIIRFSNVGSGLEAKGGNTDPRICRCRG